MQNNEIVFKTDGGKIENPKIRELENDRIEPQQPSGLRRYREKFISKNLTR